MSFLLCFEEFYTLMMGSCDTLVKLSSISIKRSYFFPSKEDVYRIKLKTENTVIENYIRNPIIFLWKNTQNLIDFSSIVITISTRYSNIDPT